jgi:hypothetical protein
LLMPEAMPPTYRTAGADLLCHSSRTGFEQGWAWVDLGLPPSPILAAIKGRLALQRSRSSPAGCLHTRLCRRRASWVAPDVEDRSDDVVIWNDTGGLIGDYANGVDRDALAGLRERPSQIFDTIESETFPALFQTLGGLERGLAWTQKEEAER